MTDRISINFLI